MPVLLPLFFLGALCAPLIMSRGRGGFAALSLIPSAAFIWLLTLIPRTARGDFYTVDIPWIPQIGLNLDIRIDVLSLVLALIASGVGGVVLFYSARYFSREASYLGRFGAIFLAFAGAMLGLVTTDNTLALYVYWELTTICSFLLIGHYSDRASSRRAAVQALVVTTFGGLAMLAGIAILGEAEGGSYSAAALIEAAQTGRLAPQQPGLITAAIVLLLLGALSKSALIPFHFWLPAAMAAPTPVSAYLHAASMVKAGVYLVARFAPGFASNPVWHWLVTITGVVTLLLGGYRALKQTDIKLVIAFGTVSQLGLIMLFVGYGEPTMLLAGMMLLLGHSLFKSALFLSVGVVDVCTGTRDLRELSGVGKQMPKVAICAALADMSMMGLPPFAAFVAKEAALTHLWGGTLADTLVLLGIAAGSALTVAYGLRFWWGAFMSKPGVAPTPVRHASYVMVIPVAVLSLLGLVAGLATEPLNKFLSVHIDQYVPAGSYGELHLWSGITGPFVLTLAIIAAGIAIFAVRERWTAWGRAHRFPLSMESIYHRIISSLERGSTIVTSRTQTGSLPGYVQTIFWTLVIGLLVAIAVGAPILPEGVRAWDGSVQALVAIVGCGGAILAARARHRLKAVILMGVAGYAVALTYELYGAPDLALTQVLSETLTLVVFVLVLRRMPIYFSSRRRHRFQVRRIALSVLVGVLFAGLAMLMAGARIHAPVSQNFAAEGFSFGYGKNIVNVTLVDIRAWDTMGEISVIVAAAVGIASLLFIRDRAGGTDRLRNVLGLYNENRKQQQEEMARDPQSYLMHALRRDENERKEGRGRRWLASDRRPGVTSRPIMLQIGTRVVFHSIIIVSLFFLFSGHNLPGGGFAGGLLAGIALVLRYLAGGRFELGVSLPVLPAHLTGFGLALATLACLAPIVLGGTPLQTARVDLNIPIFGDVHFTTALVFDTGVYLVVLGLVHEILRSLGAEIDRHGEREAGLLPTEPRLVPAADSRRDLREEMQSHEEARQRAKTMGTYSPLPSRAKGSGANGSAGGTPAKATATATANGNAPTEPTPSETGGNRD
ncbi:multicomponent Na+:H+ antiporter subunit A [Actinobaculum suis]|uniref:Multicomponent Na+:H+ antiporter subunit A n=1 Tax=Actinobaculum suis TaxID=1657 RepID=A0A1G7CMS0_9ACTO|nr:Na+/H+ antiporter subunit A [Actinobaculum suis]MDY5152539.1 Na+/H+ antiporter subunit A [Actinobaculum suis]SDE39735.1 multicomponent Na+:H+ antiporter subunit A [Actinobaculum suis]